MKCPNCKAKMKFIKTEWDDDNKGNCGSTDLYRCIRCRYEEYTES